LIITLIYLGKYLEAPAKGQANSAIRKLAGLRASVAHVLRDGQEVDLPKVGSREAIAELQPQRVQVWMITGDNRRTAERVAAQVGIPADHVLAEVLPGDKAAQVQRLHDMQQIVAFAGDGINDAPALIA
jgi:cation transport ATPase